MNVDPSMQAMQVFGSGMQITAHNIANMNTPDFQAQSYSFSTGPNDQGVRLVGPQNSGTQGIPEWRNEAFREPQPADTAVQAALQEGIDRGAATNNVDVAREMISMVHMEQNFDANAAVVRTLEETTGAVVNMKA